MGAALELVSEKEFDEAMASETTADQIRQYREMVKPEFQVEVCRKCHDMGTAFSWDEKGVLAQVQDIGDPYGKFYSRLLCDPEHARSRKPHGGPSGVRQKTRGGTGQTEASRS